MSLAIGMGIGIPFNYVLNSLVNSATTWYFGANGLAGTPWNDLTRTGLGTRIGPTGLVEYGPHNLLLQSADVSNAAWTKVATSAVSATEFAETSANSAHAILQSITVSPGIYTQIARVKAKTGVRYLAMYPQCGSVAYAIADLQAGTITATGGGGITSSGIALMSDGYYRFWVTGNFTGTTLFAHFYTSNSSATPSPGFIGDAGISSDVKLQRVIAGPVDAAENDLSTITTTTARYLPRITYDPVTLASQGLLIEGQGTNLVSTNLALWAINLYSPTLISGNRYSVNQSVLFGGIWFAATVTPGQTYTFSWLARRGTATDVKWSAFDETNGTNITSPTSYYSEISSTADTLVTKSVTAPAGCTVLRFYVARDSQAIGTLIIELPQVETGSVATSRIPNAGTGTAVRVRDGLVISGAALSAAFPAGTTAANTIVVKFRTPAAFTGDNAICGFSNGVSTGVAASTLLCSQSGSTVSLFAWNTAISTGGLVCDGSTVNTVAFSVDPVGGKTSLSVNGGATIERITGVDFTGVGVTEFGLGTIRASSSGYDHPQVLIDQCSTARSGQYITGAALQALTA